MSKKTSLLILGITSLLCSRATFFFFNDPEGPNLLIVAVLALVLFSVSLLAYVSKISETKKLPLAILVQLVVAASLYFSLV